jgi:adenine-specific DNA-methyltransferase
MITFYSKSKKNRQCKITTTQRNGFLESSELTSFLYGKANQSDTIFINEPDLWDGEENYIRFSGTNKTSSPINGILDKLITKSTDVLGNICSPLIGLESSLDDVYILTMSDVKKITNSKSNELDLIKPFFKNSDVDRYYVHSSTDKFILYLHEGINDIKQFPGIYKYLLENEKSIRSRKGANLRGAFKRGNWWVLNTPRLDMNFKDEKIVTPYRTKKLRFALSTDEWYASRDVYYIVKKKENISLKFILALLNSNLYYHWLYNRGKRKGEVLEVYAKPLKEIPIYELPIENQKRFIALVDEIIKKKSQNSTCNTFDLEIEIDILVYRLYDLTYDEVKVIDPEFPLNKKEYENISLE